MGERNELFSSQFFQQARAAKATFIRNALFRQRRQVRAPAVALPANHPAFERRATSRALRQSLVLRG